MASHNDFGKEGEDMAVEWLVRKGYEILERNWRYSKLEIDIVAKKNGLLHIVEVKSLKSSDVIFPEQAVTRKKFKALARAADQFLSQHEEYRNFQFDVLSIVTKNNCSPEFLLIEDVFL